MQRRFLRLSVLVVGRESFLDISADGGRVAALDSLEKFPAQSVHVLVVAKLRQQLILDEFALCDLRRAPLCDQLPVHSSFMHCFARLGLPRSLAALFDPRPKLCNAPTRVLQE